MPSLCLHATVCFKYQCGLPLVSSIYLLLSECYAEVGFRARKLKKKSRLVEKVPISSIYFLITTNYLKQRVKETVIMTVLMQVGGFKVFVTVQSRHITQIQKD